MHSNNIYSVTIKHIRPLGRLCPSSIKPSLRNQSVAVLFSSNHLKYIFYALKHKHKLHIRLVVVTINTCRHHPSISTTANNCWLWPACQVTLLIFASIHRLVWFVNTKIVGSSSIALLGISPILRHIVSVMLLISGSGLDDKLFYTSKLTRLL